MKTYTVRNKFTVRPRLDAKAMSFLRQRQLYFIKLRKFYV